MTSFSRVFDAYSRVDLVWRILTGLAIGAILGIFFKNLAVITLLGSLFVGALKGVAPVLVFALVLAALAQGGEKLDRRFATVITLYLASTFLASALAVCASFAFPQTLQLVGETAADGAPASLGDVLMNLTLGMTINLVDSIAQGRYIGVLFWAAIIGMALQRVASDSTKRMANDCAEAVGLVARWIVNLAPFGIMGLVYTNVSTNGMAIFADYGRLVALLVGCMLISALVVNPAMVAIILRANPYPLIWRGLRESGVTAFFTRSSAANIPVNMSLCEDLGLDKEMYAVSIPIGATINMNGAAITIAIMALAAATTVGVHVSLFAALALSVIATLGACGAAGVAGGSLLLIPMACSLFGVSSDAAMQVVGVGFIIGVLQDSMETALNSSGDVVFTATAEYASWKRRGKSLPTFLGGTTVVGSRARDAKAIDSTQTTRG